MHLAHTIWQRSFHSLTAITGLLLAASPLTPAAEIPPFEEFHKLVDTYCVSCHGPQDKQSGIDYTTFLKPEDYQGNLEVLEAMDWVLPEHEMPPVKAEKQPTEAEREKMIAWVQGTLLAMQNTSPNDPGLVVMPRLTNKEFDNVLQDLTGKDITVSNLLPGEPIAGEGFSNVGQAQDISPARVEKYLSAADRALAHARVTPITGIVWHDKEQSKVESPQKLREEIANQWVELHRAQEELLVGKRGNPRVEPYLEALWRYRYRAEQGRPQLTFQELAENAEKPLAAKSLEILFDVFDSGAAPDSALEDIYAPWLKLGPDASPEEVEKALEAVKTRRGVFSARLHEEPGYELEHPYGRVKNPIKHETFYLSLLPSIGGQEAPVAIESVTAQFKDDETKELPLPAPVLKPTEVLEIPVPKGALKIRVKLAWDETQAPEGFVMAPYLDDEPPEAESAAPAAAGEYRDHAWRIVWPMGDIVERFNRNRDHLQDVYEIRNYFRGQPFMLQRRYTVFFQDVEGLDLTLFGSDSWTGWDLEADMAARKHESHKQNLREIHGKLPNRPFILEAKHLRESFTAEGREEMERLYAEMTALEQKPHAEIEALAKSNGLTEIVEGQLPPEEEVAKWSAQDQQRFQKLLAEMQGIEAKLAAVAGEQIAQFARKAWQEPAPAEKVAGLVEVFEAKRRIGGSYDAAMKQALKAVLLSPRFLYRAVRVQTAGEGREELDNRELADRLAAFFWAARPDETLLSADLQDPQVLQQQIQRLLKNDRSRALASEFAGYWLGFAGFTEYTVPNPNKFPEYTESLRNAMYQESILFFEDLFRENRPVSAIYNADYTFLNQELARHYGISGVNGDYFRKVQVDTAERGGIFGMGSVLTKTSTALRTSPVLRGVWILTSILGEPLPEPPPNVPELSEDTTDEKGRTITEQLAAHRENPACLACHERIDPPGVALENFDPIGRWRDSYTESLPVQTTSTLRDGSTMEGLAGLREYLRSKHETFAENFCRKLIGYALSRPFLITDKPLVEQMTAALEDNDGRVQSALLVLVNSPQFREKRVTPKVDNQASLR